MVGKRFLSLQIEEVGGEDHATRTSAASLAVKSNNPPSIIRIEAISNHNVISVLVLTVNARYCPPGRSISSSSRSLQIIITQSRTMVEASDNSWGIDSQVPGLVFIESSLHEIVCPYSQS